MITKRKRERRDTQLLATELKTFYLNKYYNIFMNRYKFPELDYQQNDFLLRNMWSNGTISAFKLYGSDNEENPNGLLVLVQYAPAEFNIYDYPVKATLINKRGVAWIPSTLQEVDKDIVIGWAQRNFKSVYQMVNTLIEKIVDVEMKIRTNLKATNSSTFVFYNPEDRDLLNRAIDSADDNEPYIFVPFEYADKVKSFNTGAQYNVDSLYNYKCSLENELREYLGIENLGFAEKKEHLLNSEIEQNDNITKTSGNTFVDCMQEFCDRVTEILGYPLHLEINSNDDFIQENEETVEEEETQSESY